MSQEEDVLYYINAAFFWNGYITFFFVITEGLTVETFLQAIGKECDQYVNRFSTWEDLFTTKGLVMKMKEIPIKQRRWILHWVEKYRKGETPNLKRSLVDQKNREHLESVLSKKKK